MVELQLSSTATYQSICSYYVHYYILFMELGIQIYDHSSSDSRQSWLEAHGMCEILEKGHQSYTQRLSLIHI